MRISKWILRFNVLWGLCNSESRWPRKFRGSSPNNFMDLFAVKERGNGPWLCIIDNQNDIRKLKFHLYLKFKSKKHLRVSSVSIWDSPCDQRRIKWSKAQSNKGIGSEEVWVLGVCAFLTLKRFGCRRDFYHWARGLRWNTHEFLEAIKMCFVKILICIYVYLFYKMHLWHISHKPWYFVTHLPRKLVHSWLF